MSSFRALAESLDRCVDPNDPEVNYLLRSLATYAMVQALYFSTGKVYFKFTPVMLLKHVLIYIQCI